MSPMQYAVVAMVICTIFGAGVGVTWHIQDLRRAQLLDAMEHEFDDMRAALKSDITRNTAAFSAVSAAACGIFEANATASLRQFNAMASRVLQFNMSSQLSWADYVKDADRPAYESRIRADYPTLLSNASVIVRTDPVTGARGPAPPDAAPDYFVVSWIYPLIGNTGAVLYDLQSQSARAEALATARDSGLPAATAGIR
jgi:CHASE1-domain containing sensor protein